MRRVVVGRSHDGKGVIATDDRASVVIGVTSGSADSPALPRPRLFEGVAPAPGAGEVVIEYVWCTQESPVIFRPGEDPVLPLRHFERPGVAAYGPQESRWQIVRFGPHVFLPMHRTPTIDYGTVISGALDLILESGQTRLAAGDCYVIPGLPHSWRTGDEGCVTSVVLLGLAAT